MRPAARSVAVGGILLAVGITAPVAVANDAALVRAYDGAYRATEASSGRIGPPEGTQVAYNAARDLQEGLRAAAPVSAECRRLLGALSRYASGRVLQAEGVDRPSAGDQSTGRARAERARSAISSARSSCRGRGGRSGGASAPVISPARGEAFFGVIVAKAPSRATSAVLYDGSVRAAETRIRGGRARFRVNWRQGAHNVRVVFRAGARTVGSVSSPGAWMLSPSHQRAVPGSRADRSLERSLTGALSGGPRYRAAWVQGVRSGRAAGVNAGALFPAASTVKLGLLAGVLARLGARPEESAYAYDLRAMAAWSSNLANNRLVQRFGNGAATDGLRRLGARVSTFTGEYIVGTELQPALPRASAVNAPPRTSQRVTSAQDLARMLLAFHASAVNANARGHTGLTAHQARLALGWLLASQQRGDNLGLFAGGVPSGAPIAQKNGWINSARLGAALIYGPSGPVIAVLATYDENGVSLGRAQATGARVARVALSAN